VSIKAKDSRRDGIAMVMIAEKPAINLASSHFGLDRFDIGHENIFAGHDSNSRYRHVQTVTQQTPKVARKRLATTLRCS
jgi:hypothetical protein